MAIGNTTGGAPIFETLIRPPLAAQDPTRHPPPDTPPEPRRTPTDRVRSSSRLSLCRSRRSNHRRHRYVIHPPAEWREASSA